MAIYSCNLRSIGRTTHAAGTAGAHLRYIGREDAAAQTFALHMPETPQEARTWMDGHERESRKNARLCDKIRLALPRELDEAQRADLVRDFMDGLGQGRVPWYAAIHQTGKDAQNPHAHIVVVDRDIETGKRVLGLSDSTRDRQKKGLPGPSAVEWVRERWEACANRALERAGHAVRIDRRSLEAQGIERDPQIHVGPRAQHIDTQIKRPESKPVPDPSPHDPGRVIDYPMIDAGRTRRERNTEIIDLNLEREARSPHFETRVLAQFEREQRGKDRPLDAQLTAAARRRTLEERRIRREHTHQTRDIRARRAAEARLVRGWIRGHHAPETTALQARHAEERAALAQRQDRVFGRFFAAVDFTGRTRSRREADRKALSARHKGERQALATRLRENRAAQLEAVEARYGPQLEEVAQSRKERLGRLADRHAGETAQEDALLQQRAAEREQARRAVQDQIDTWKRMQKAQEQRQAKETDAPARSKAGQAWTEADAPPAKQSGESRAEAARRRMEEAEERRRRERNRRRDRGYERD